jgi:hypothetical protein
VLQLVCCGSFCALHHWHSIRSIRAGLSVRGT